MMDSLRLFCFPYAGANTAMFRRWRGCLPPEVELSPIELPGRGNRISEPLCDDLRTLVLAAAASVAPLLDRPFALFGHSMGALVAFELARHLRSRVGLSPAALYVSGRRAPQLDNPAPPFYALPEPEFFAAVRGLNGTPEEFFENEALRSLITPILRADFRVVQTYALVPGEPLSCPITAFSGRDDDQCGPATMEPWREHTTGPFSLKTLPGDHFFVDSQTDELLSLLADELRRALQAISPGRGVR